MVSMKLSKKETASKSEVAADIEYGYGLMIHLEKEQVNALKLGTPKPGAKVSIKALAVVQNISMSQDKQGIDKHVCLQITDMEATISGKDAASTLYGA
jgi:hypothetical protein